MVWWRAYNRLVDIAPLRTSMASSAILWSAGDLTAQFIESRVARPPDTKPYNWRRTAVQVRAGYVHPRCVHGTCTIACAWRVQTAYASLLWAPAAHYWYALLERGALLMATPGTRRLVALKLAAEMVLLHPVSLVAFFGGAAR